ncbi:MAG: post-transcriptional regulator [Erysipelotrichaceae bacterium]
MNANELLNDSNIKCAISLKTNKLIREELSSLTYQQVEETLVKYKWNGLKDVSLHDAINDILHLKANEIISYLSTKAIIEGSKMDIEDFKDLID